MPRSISLPLVIGLLWLVPLGGYLLTVPLDLSGVEFSRLAITSVFSDWWHDFWGAETVSLDQFVKERFDLWLTALVGCLGIWTSGRLLLRLPLFGGTVARMETLDLNLAAYGIGLSLATTLVLFIGVVGGLNVWLFRLLVAVPLFLEFIHWWRNRRSSSAGPRPLPFRQHLGLALCLVPFLLIMFLGATQPPLDFDVREYHLEGPKEYYLAGQITYLDHNVYTNFPSLTEMFSLLGMLLRGEWYRGALAGKLMLMPLVPLTGLALFSIARKLYGETSGWLACLVWCSIPWALTLATTAYVEGGMLFYLALTLLLAVRLMDRSGTTLRGSLFLLGLFAGASMACKYPGLIWGVLPAGAFAAYILYCQSRDDTEPIDRAQILKQAGLFAAGVTAAVGPWLCRNLIFTGNPVFPLAYSWFGGPGWTPELHAMWKAAHAVPSDSIAALPDALFNRLVTDPRQSPLLLMFAPLLFLRKESRDSGALLLGLAVYVTLMWWFVTHRIDRFWLPAILPLAVMAGGGFTWSDSPYWHRYSRIAGFVVMGVTLTMMISTIGTPLPIGNPQQLTRQLTEQHVRLIYTLNENLPDDARVLLVGEAQVFDARFEPIYNTVFNQSEYLKRVAVSPETGDLKSTDEIKQSLRESQIDYIGVNWEEILRYRTTYGFNKAIVPAHLKQLVDRKLLSEPVILWMGKFDEMSESNQAEYKAWAPELIQTHEGESYVVLGQLYRVN